MELQSARTIQVSYAYRVTDHRRAVTLDLEVPLLAVPNRSINGANENIAADYSALFLLPGIRARADTGARLFFIGSVGAGWARFQERERLPSGSPNREQTVNSLGIGFGIGLGIQVTAAIDVRLEVRGVGAKRSLSFDDPDEWSLNSMGFLGGNFRF